MLPSFIYFDPRFAKLVGIEAVESYERCGVAESLYFIWKRLKGSAEHAGNCARPNQQPERC